ncbi:putative transcriptional regulator with an HTH domain [Archaeoglobus sulfaticallidus PM70-1]|uniref:Putative transcriptional regulator with an HTH domain n=1 Tax=Archaeoglobus sulfaticallidus PM70-1 TaxID=387631 RepID=N0B9W6_9EURY|nr:helix-turn-helix domain-containing protein [Archaeoglobus sulfaticallidus]AGK60389.1 putative transcriptional regulator with an HTH domain [Archaeoglobus sulfaticallidus PM70-1]
MIDKLVNALIKGDEAFSRELERVIHESGMDLKHFSEICGVPYPTLYKIVRGERKPTATTLRKILRAFKRDEEFIAIIATRYILEESSLAKKFPNVRTYSANNFEEAIVNAVRAEKEGARAIIVAPILSSTIEKIVDVPVFTMRPKYSLIKAVEDAMKRI